MRQIIIIIIIILIVGGGTVFYVHSLINTGSIHSEATDQPNQSASNFSGKTAKTTDVALESTAQTSEYPHTKAYTHQKFNFSFNYPEDFQVSSTPSEDGGEIVLIQNKEKDLGIQILISPTGEPDSDITAEVIRQSLPDMKVIEPREVPIASNRNGLLFISDNQAFGGKSSEAWFVYGGRLYQMSASAESDRLLKGLFSTWRFN